MPSPPVKDEIVARRVFCVYTVLLAEDRSAPAGLKEVLENMGFGRIEVFQDGLPDLDQIRKLKPNLVVAPQNSTPITGFQLLTAVRGDEATARIPFIIVQGGPVEEAAEAAIGRLSDYPPAALVEAPVEPERFSQAVVTLLDPLIDPKQEEAFGLIREADALGEAGDQSGAAEKYQQALNLYDHHLDAWLKMAQILADLGRFDEAEISYLAALEVDKYSLRVYFALAEYYENREDYEQTIGVLKQAQGIAEMIKATGKSLSKLNFFIGEFELRLKRLSAAKTSFNKAIELAPDDVKLQTDIGDAYADKGYDAESEKHYRAALEVDPNLAHIFNKLGMAYRRQKKHKKALDLYNNARRHHPDDENLMFNMARTHLEADDQATAVQMLEKALALAPDFKEAKALLAKLVDGDPKSGPDAKKKQASEANEAS